MQSHKLRSTLLPLLLLGAAAAVHLPAQTSSSSSDTPAAQADSSSKGPSLAIPETSGSPITLETSEPLFDLAAALNTCGYDADLSASLPIRDTLRSQIQTLAAATPDATKAREAVCQYVRTHTLTDSARSLAQYISLALFLSPDLTATVDETELPPDANQVVSILPPLRTFVEQAHLHALWVEHRADYATIVDRLHAPLTRMILETNIYLKSPVSSYDGRRFLVLVEPLLAPSSVNARIYGANYIIVVSPSQAGQFHMEQIRHTYLHYEVEPLVYARASAMDRLQPLLKTVQDAPIEFSYKSDVVALITECLIKAIEARTMDTGLVKPVKPTVVHQRSELEQYDTALGLYQRQSEAARRNAADLATHHGWVLTDYFYNQLIQEEHSGVSLRENIAQMVYGMDVDREVHSARNLTFTPETNNQEARRVSLPPTGLRLAELKLMQGNADDARRLAEKALADPKGDHSEANYILARIALLEKQPESAQGFFRAALTDAHDPRTAAWSHIYLGRLYDVEPNRRQAVAEYRAALQILNDTPGSPIAAGLNEPRTAANAGLKTPFALPKQQESKDADDDSAPVDPTGKAEKDSYQPTAPR